MYPANERYVVRFVGLSPARGREPCVPLRRCSDRDRDIFAVADLGAVGAFDLNYDRYCVARRDARGTFTPV